MCDDAGCKADQLFAEHGERALFLAAQCANEAASKNDADAFGYWSAVVKSLKDKLATP